MSIMTSPFISWLVAALTVCIWSSVTYGNATVTLAYLSRHQGGFFKHAGGGFFLAMEDRANDLVPFNITMNHIIRDTQGKDYKGYEYMIDLARSQNVTAFFGPGHDCACSASVATSLKVPYMAYDCVYTPTSDSSKPKSFADHLAVMTQPSDVMVARFISAILDHYGWKTFTIISGISEMWKETARLIRLQASNHIKVKIYKENDRYNPSFNSSVFRDMILSTYNETRVYVYLGHYHSLIHFLGAMQELGLMDTNEYAVIATRMIEAPISDDSSRFFNTFEAFETDTDIEKLKAFRNVLVLMKRSININLRTDTSQRMDQRNQKPPMNLSRPAVIQHLTPPFRLIAAYLYDAVTLYIKAVVKVANRSGDFLDPRQIITEMRDTKYMSLVGLEMYIDNQGNNDGNFTVWSINVTGSTPHEQMIPVGFFIKESYNSTESKLRFIRNSNPIGWVSGKPPPDIPKCGFNGENCQRKNLTVVVVCSVLGVAVVVAALILLFRHYLYEQKLDRLLWKINRSEIQFLDKRDVDMCRKPKKIYHRWATLLMPKDSGELEDLCVPTPRVEQELTMGVYRGTQVVIKTVTKKTLEISRSMKKQLQLRKELNHENINRFVGACIETPQIYILSQYCSRRSLHDIIQNENSPLDEMFVASLVADLIKGMMFIHDSRIISHGNLKSSNCLVDSRWVLQIAEFGLHSLYSSSQSIKDETRYFKRLQWKAPELLRTGSHDPRGSQKGDVYSFALILYDIHGRQGPWGNIDMSVKEIVQSVKDCGSDSPFRPSTELLHCQGYIISCMKECWAENPESRPDFKLIKQKLRDMHNGLKNNIFDNMIAMMEKYADTLEQQVAERTQELFIEKKMTENLLLRMLPRSVAERLKQNQPVIPEQYECVSIYFSDIVGFTSISAQSTPMQVVDLLNDLYILFDSVIESYDVYKVETIGDAYMVVSGLPIRNEDRHAGEVASFSLLVLGRIRNFRIRHMPEASVQIRIGLHSGPCCAGVVGQKMPRYCLFGDTVNTASRMETTGEAMKIHCSRQCKEKLDKLGGYILQERGIVNVKGKGEQKTYFLQGEDPTHRVRRISQEKNKEGRCVSMGNLDYGKPLINTNAFKNSRLMSNSYVSDNNPSRVDKLPVTQEVVNMGEPDQDEPNETIRLLTVPESVDLRVTFKDEGHTRHDRTRSCGDVIVNKKDPWKGVIYTRSNSRT